MGKILIVEDDRDLSRGLRLALRDMEFEIALCFDLRSAREKIAHGAPDLVLLDVNLPDGSGLDLLRESRAAGDTPVILLTANDTEMDVVAGLDGGADDYITKPFSLAILRARVKAQLRRNTAGHPLLLDGFRFDFDRMEFYRGERQVDLSRTEQKLLRLLVENRGITMSRSVLLDRVWSDGADFVDENALSVTVKRLRDKLDAAAFIRTVYGVGYVWTVKRDE